MMIIKRTSLLKLLNNRPKQLFQLHRTLSIISSPTNNPQNHPSSSIINHLSYGQPTAQTHPHYFKGIIGTGETEIMPGITQSEFRSRRSKLLDLAINIYRGRSKKSPFQNLGFESYDIDIPESETISSTTTSPSELSSSLNHLIIIPAAHKKFMTENIPFVFRQNSNFLYLSGSFDPEALIVLGTFGNTEIHSIFVTDPDPISDLWDGRKTSPKGCLDYYGFDQAFYLSQFESWLRDVVQRERENLVIWCEDRSIIDKVRLNERENYYRPIQSPKLLLDSMRVIKSPGEIELMKTTCKIASQAFQEAIHMTGCESDSQATGFQMTESKIWARIDYECRRRGAWGLAYPPVVASGARANIIHYVFNSNVCGPQEMVLVDAGCEFFGYCSDITRTWPLGPGAQFSSDHHRSLYEMIHELQGKLLSQIEPEVTLDQLFRFMGPLLINGLKELGIISQESLDQTNRSLNTTELALKFCPHHVSHYLGMDVHDASTYSRSVPLKPGCIITMEPGVYVSNQEQLTKVGQEFIGIGIRIEDDVLVTPNGCEVLTSSCPKTIYEIEKVASPKGSPEFTI